MTTTGAMKQFSAAKQRGFTLLELLIVIAVIGVLASLIFGVVGTIGVRKKKILALTQVKGIEDAAKQYFQDFSVYPPDTDNYETDDPLPNGLSSSDAKYGIKRYLGNKLVDTKTGATHGPYLDIQDKYLKGDPIVVDGQNAQLFVDPWGNAYEMDCMHVLIDKKAKKIGKPSYPYPPGTPEEQCVFEVKVWSKGPDGKSSKEAPFFPIGSAPEDDDNIMTWTNAEKSSK